MNYLTAEIQLQEHTNLDYHQNDRKAATLNSLIESPEKV